MLTNFVYCIADVETEVVGNSIDPEKDKLKYIGFKNHLGNKVVFHYPTDKVKIQKTFSFFKYIVGHNIKEYDKIVLERHGFKFDYKQVFIDTLEISNNRLKQMLYLDIDDKSLGNLCEVFKLQHKKSDFDYDLLAKDKLEGKEYDWMVEYLYGDLDSTDDLFQHYYNMFIGFRELMNAKDQERMSWLTSSSGTVAYKVICYHAGLPEEYNDDAEMAAKAYEGAFVSEPYIDFIEG